MFEVFLNVNIEEIRLGVLDKTKDGKEVWNRRRILLTGSHETGSDEIIFFLEIATQATNKVANYALKKQYIV